MTSEFSFGPLSFLVAPLSFCFSLKFSYLISFTLPTCHMFRDASLPSYSAPSERPRSILLSLFHFVSSLSIAIISYFHWTFPPDVLYRHLSFRLCFSACSLHLHFYFVFNRCIIHCFHIFLLPSLSLFPSLKSATGTGASGKSTFLKQLKVIHKEGFSATEIDQFRDSLPHCTVLSMQKLLKPLLESEKKLSSRRKAAAEKILDAEELTEELATVIKEFWEMEEVKVKLLLYLLSLSLSSLILFLETFRESLRDWLPSRQLCSLVPNHLFISFLSFHFVLKSDP